MIHLTMIGRFGDGLILTESVQQDEQTGKSNFEYHSQAKALLKKLSYKHPPISTLETGPYNIHYIIADNVVYLALCERSFQRRTAFAYLDELKSEFSAHYGKQVANATRPYCCIEFDNYMQKTKRSFMDARGRRNFSNLNIELQDVQRIMVQNIDDVLQRGAALSDLDSKATSLSMLSEKYKKDAHRLNLNSMYTKLAGTAIVVFVMFLYFWVL